MVGNAEQRPRIVDPEVTVRLRHTDPASAVLEVTGDLDGPAVERLRAAVPLAASHRLVVDLSGVTFMASSGINWLVGLNRRVDQLLVRSPSPIVLRVLQVTGVADVLDIVSGSEPEGRSAAAPAAAAD